MSGMNVILSKGRSEELTSVLDALERALASSSWSKASSLVRFTVSTSMNFLPSRSFFVYQKELVPFIQLGVMLTLNMDAAAFSGKNLSAFS